MEIALAIMAGVFALVGSLGGVAMTQRHQERLALDERQHSERVEVRELITRLARVASDWVSMMEFLPLAFVKFESKDHMEFVDTDTGKALRDTRRALRDILAEAALRIGDETLLGPLGEVARQFETAEVAIGEIFDGRSNHGEDAAIEIALAAVRQVRTFQRKVTALEVAAAPLVRTSIRNALGERRSAPRRLLDSARGRSS